MTKYLLIAMAALTLALGVSGWYIKSLVESTGSLKAEVANRDEAITQLSAEVDKAREEATRLDQIVAERDTEKRQSQARADNGKAAVRLAVKNDPSFAACAGVVVPAGITDRLRTENDHQNAGGEAVPAKPFVKRVLDTWNP